jgi:hypothetical protein
MNRLLAVMVLSSFPVTAVAQQAFVFAGGAGEVTLPSNFEQVDDPDAALVVIDRPEGNIRLFFDLHKLDAAIRPSMPAPAEELVSEQAQKKNAKLYKFVDRVVMFEPGREIVVDGRRYFNLHWQVGFGATLIVFTAEILRDAQDEPDVKQFFASHALDTIARSLRRIGE